MQYQLLLTVELNDMANID